MNDGPLLGEGAPPAGGERAVVHARPIASSGLKHQGSVGRMPAMPRRGKRPHVAVKAYLQFGLSRFWNASIQLCCTTDKSIALNATDAEEEDRMARLTINGQMHNVDV